MSITKTIKKTTQIVETDIPNPKQLDKTILDMASNASTCNSSPPSSNRNQPPQPQTQNLYDNNKNIIIAKSCGFRRLPGREIYCLIADQNITTAIVVNL